MIHRAMWETFLQTAALFATVAGFCGGLAAAEPISVADDATGILSQESPQRRGFGRGMAGVYKARIEPHWLDDGTRFWYRNDLRDDTKEFILVDAEEGTRSAAFDHARLAAALSEAAGQTFAADRLPFEEIEYTEDGSAIQFTAADAEWSCDLESYECTKTGDAPAVEDPGDERRGFDGRRGRRGRGFGQRRGGPSPDEKWIARVHDGNVFLREADGEEEEEIQLTDDGTEEIGYGMLQWAPDSKTLVAFKIDPGDRKEVYLVESSPEEGGRARLHTRSYDLPGDKLTSYELSLFDVEERKQTRVDVEKIDLGWPRIHWKADGRHFAYEKVDRGHQRFRVICVDSHTGEHFNIIDEETDTFIWTAHTENVDLDFVNWLDETDEVIYASERDGWRHLYLIDGKAGEIKNQITQGDYVVRGIDRIDEEKRQIWFRAGGKNAEQDPYFIHFYRVNFDGTGLVALTEGDGTHSVQYSPERKYLIDTYSRVDRPPVHELRRTSDGALVCPLEEADVSELEARGAHFPEVFTAKGRDGETDIWGIICRPRDFDPDKKYPIIEQIYAGPQGSFVPKSFVGGDRFSSLTELGFIVVQIDGMGTANRSKAFHDVCWHNLKDGGLPDRIAWIKAAAEKYPYMDTSRVGIYGTSAGGQNAAAAVLFHGDFYKAAVANCGCHDNRMDKASWNEQWMGYPVGPHYSECSNIDNAHRLEGDLFLIVGEMDTNVPPESTTRFADALIKADKDFEFLLVPGGGHGAGSARNYHTRRMHDFFVRHLQGKEPPDRNGRGEEDEKDVENDEEADEDQQSAEDAEEGEEKLDLASIEPERDPVGRIAGRYRADRGSLERFYFVEESPNTRDRMRRFYVDWLTALTELPDQSLTDGDREELDELKDEILGALAEMEQDARADAQAEPLVPFAATILALAEDRQHVRKVDPQEAAGRVAEVSRQVDEATRALRGSSPEEAPEASSASRERAADLVERLREHLESWHAFYNGYDPEFTWWMRAPYEEADKKLAEYAAALGEEDEPSGEAASPDPQSGAGATSREARPSERDVPDLAELMDDEPTRMQRVIEQFQSETRRERGRRGFRGRSGRRERDGRRARVREDAEDREESADEDDDDEDEDDANQGERADEDREAEERAARAEAARRRREQTLRRWESALAELDFEGLSQSERVDYLLLANHVEYGLHRLDREAAEAERGRPEPVDESGIAGRPIGREALLAELAHEMIAYTPEELIEIAEKEYAWCQAELKKAAQEMGLGDDWRAAVEKVKTMHVAPGEQPYLIDELAWEAIDYLKKYDLLTVPPLAAETWRMQMMSPERQLINPFFTGGTTISVSFPTDTMSHEAKLQSMRGNNIPFARATVHHELIPGHNLQAYMNSRYSTHRRLFSTPFWGEGWALYWEMLLYERGFPQTPEDRVGFLVWRQHRCARIVFSLGFHLGQMTPQECIDYLVANVGFERNNSEAEVRRSFATSYVPLYQAAYMLGGLQFRSLHRELVQSGKMTDREFHDAILKEGSMPVVMVRALLTGEPVSRDEKPQWRFYEGEASE